MTFIGRQVSLHDVIKIVDNGREVIYCFTTTSGQGYANSLMPSLKGQDYGFDAFLLIVSELQLIAQRSDGRIFPDLVDATCRGAIRRIRPEETSHDGL
jgi:hypothetical protein